MVIIIYVGGCLFVDGECVLIGNLVGDGDVIRIWIFGERERVLSFN